MGHCDNDDFVGHDDIHKPIGKAAQHALAELVVQLLPCAGELLDPAKGFPRGGEELLAETRPLCFVVLDTFEEFGGGNSKKSRLQRRALSRS